jgi:putative ABC transport system permease protein
MRRFLSSVVLGIQAAFAEIRVQPLRSGLSIAGVAMAVGALAAILSLVAGLRNMMNEAIADMGGAGRMTIRVNEPEDPLEGKRFSRSPGLRDSDGGLVADSTGARVVPLPMAGSHAEASFLGRPERVYLMGCGRDYLTKDVSAIIQEGELPDSAAWARGEPVALVGWTLATRWQENAAARGVGLVGSRIVVQGVPYTIAGTFRFKRSNWGRNGITVAIPLAAWNARHQKPFATVSNLQMRFENPESTTVLLPRLQEWLKGAHRGVEDVSLDLFQFLSEIARMMGNIALLLGIVAALSLSVGALGIFNTMLAGYHDRVREIGVRKALGARRAQIFVEFLVESTVLSAIGGLLGLTLGMVPPLFGDVLYDAFGLRPVFDAAGALEAFSVSVVVGVLAGLWPALRASRLDPVDALRYE